MEMTMTDIISMVTSPLNATISTVADIIPYVIAAIIILLVGWIAGRFLGKVGSVIVQKTGIEKSFESTPIGKNFSDSSYSLSQLTDYVIRIVVYLLAIMSAADTLQIQSLQSIIAGIVAFIPHIIAFILILFIGLLLVDYFADFMGRMGKASDIELINPLIVVLRIFLYFIVIVLAITQLNINLDIIYAFIIPLSWGISLGVGGAIILFFGWGLRDKSPELLDQFLGKNKP